jgi:hypothetical protein
VPAGAASPVPATGQPAAIALAEPELMKDQAGVLRLAWGSPAALPPGAVYDVRVCKGAGCRPALGRTNVTETTWHWCPDEGAGRYRWQVWVVDEATKNALGPASPVGELTWAGGECAEDSDEPPPTPVPEPTPWEPGPEP